MTWFCSDAPGVNTGKTSGFAAVLSPQNTFGWKDFDSHQVE
jgi:hypothetical protein